MFSIRVITQILRFWHYISIYNMGHCQAKEERSQGINLMNLGAGQGQPYHSFQLFSKLTEISRGTEKVGKCEQGSLQHKYDCYILRHAPKIFEVVDIYSSKAQGTVARRQSLMQ